MTDSISTLYIDFSKIIENVAFAEFDRDSKNEYLTSVRIQFNDRIRSIVSDPNYDPDQWVTEFDKMWSPPPHPHQLSIRLIIYQFMMCLDFSLYDAFPTEWWILIYRNCPLTIEKKLKNELPSRREFFERIILLSELQN